MELESLFVALHLDPAKAALFRPHWAESMAALPGAGPDWLRDDAVLASRRFVGLAPDYDAPLLATARAVRADGALSGLAWHAARLAFEHLDYDLGQARFWPELGVVLGEKAPLFYLLVAFQAVPHLRRAHRRRGISEDVSRATCTHYLESTSLYRLTHAGRLGVRPAMLGWLRHHISGELCCLGRMEYMIKPFQGRLCAFRHREQGLLVALAENGASFAGCGLGTVPARPAARRLERVPGAIRRRDQRPPDLPCRPCPAPPGPARPPPLGSRPESGGTGSGDPHSARRWHDAGALCRLHAPSDGVLPAPLPRASLRRLRL
jgi:hypothetical protein